MDGGKVREMGIFRNTDYGNQCYDTYTSHFYNGVQFCLEAECDSGFDAGYNQTCNFNS